MQLSKRGKEPVEQPLFRVSERSRRTPRPRRIPVGFFRNPRPPHAASATNPRGTRAQPAPYHHPCLPKSRQNPRRALNFRPSRSSRGIRHSAPVQPRHFGCGIRNPLSLRMSATRLHGPNPRRSSGSADNLPKNGYAESSENLPPRQPAEPCGNGKTRPSRLSRKPRRTEPRKARCVSRQAPDGFTPYSVRPLAPQSGRSATARPNPISASQRPGHARRCRAPPNRSMRSRFRRILPRPLRPPQAAAGKRP